MQGSVQSGVHDLFLAFPTKAPSPTALWLRRSNGSTKFAVLIHLWSESMASLVARLGLRAAMPMDTALGRGTSTLTRRGVSFASGRAHRRTPRRGCRHFSQQSRRQAPFSSRLRDALRNSKIEWYQIPVGLGIAFLGAVQFYKVSSRAREEAEAQDGTAETRPRKRPRVRPDGPW